VYLWWLAGKALTGIAATWKALPGAAGKIPASDAGARARLRVSLDGPGTTASGSLLHQGNPVVTGLERTGLHPHPLRPS
jgi:hypothetical protein